MKKLIITLFSALVFSFTCYSQLPSEIKHIEIISEVRDTMALINKDDVNQINTIFYRQSVLDSLNIINEEIIKEQKTKIVGLNNIIIEKDKIIDTNNLKIESLISSEKESEELYLNQIKKEKNRTVFWQSTTGLSVIAIVILAIL